MVYSPTDLIRYLASPFSSWMDRYHLENPSDVVPDQPTDDQRLVAQTGNQHEQDTLVGFRASAPGLVEIGGVGFEEGERSTLLAVHAKAPVIYQAALKDDRFAGFADFLILNDAGRYQVWDAKLARSPKPYFAIQLCCYSEMFAASAEEPLPTKFGIVLGTGDRVALNVEDFIYYYRRVRRGFLALQDGFTGRLADRPEPLPRADHGMWTSHADEFFDSKDHLVRVAGITVGQIKKLKAAGIPTVCELAASSARSVHKLAASTLEKLAAQARLQSQTRADRLANPEALARYEILPNDGDHGVRGLAALPPEHRADVFFDMEGYPLVPGGLEYLFGACSFPQHGKSVAFHDWWAHDRSEEKVAFESFVGWVANSALAMIVDSYCWKYPRIRSRAVLAAKPASLTDALPSFRRSLCSSSKRKTFSRKSSFSGSCRSAESCSSMWSTRRVVETATLRLLRFIWHLR